SPTSTSSSSFFSHHTPRTALYPLSLHDALPICAVHPGAWWLWALGLAAAASRTSNPLLLVLVMCTAGDVVARRRTDAPWALAFRFYLLVGVLIIVSRVFFRVVFGGGQGEIVLFTLPEIPLPETAGGIRLLGPVALE